MKKLYPILLLLVLATIFSACAPGRTEEISQDQAVAIAKVRFDEYLQKHPEMEVKDPVYTAKKKEDKAQKQYWSVTIELQEEAYAHYYYEVIIRLDGRKVTLATG